MHLFPFIPSSVLVWLIESTISISILVCLIFLVKAVTRYRLPAWWHYGLWVLLVIRMLIPGVLESRLSVFSLVPALGVNSVHVSDLIQGNLQGAAIEGIDIADEDAEGLLGNVTRNSRRWGVSADQALLLTWLIGIGIFCLVAFVKNLRFWEFVRRKQPVEDGDILSMLRECKRQMGVERDVCVVMTDAVASPAIFGYLRPKLLLPENVLDRIDRNQLHYIFLHELGHIKRHDIAVSCLMTVLQAIHWFNPFVWYAFYCMRADMEAACDAHVLSRVKSDRSAGYAHTVIGILERFYHNRPLPALLGIVEDKAQMKRRITMIMRFRKSTPRMAVLSTALLLAFALVFFTGTSGLSTAKDGGHSLGYKDVYELTPLVIRGEAVTQKLSEPEDHSGYTPEAFKALSEAQEIMKTDDFAGGKQILLDYLATEPDDIPIVLYHMLGYAYSRDGYIMKAQSVYRDGYRTYPDSGDLLLNYAISTWELGKLVEAAPLFEKAYDTSQVKDARLLHQAAAAWYDAEVFAESKRVLRRMLDLDGKPESEWYRMIANACMELGQYDEAREYLSILKERGDIVEHAPDDPSGHDLRRSHDEGTGRTIYTLSEVDRPPRVIRKYDPLYPHSAREESIEGNVILRFIVSYDGNVIEPVVLKGKPAGVFDDSALSAILRWKFESAIKDGRPVDAVLVLPLNFKMHSSVPHSNGT